MHRSRLAATPLIHGNDKDNTIHGTAGDDVIIGNGGDDLLQGRGGDDKLSGGYGLDTVMGGDGNDTLESGANDADGTVRGDVLNGGSGDDSVHAKLGDTLIGGAGRDYLDLLLNGTGVGTVDLTQREAETTYGSVIDGFEGGYINIYKPIGQLIMGDGFWRVQGSFEADQITATTGPANVYGGDGDDTIIGGSTHDKLDGGLGADVLTGGARKDIFVFGGSPVSAPDRITDLENKDRIEVYTGQGVHLVDHFTGHRGDTVLTYDAGADVTYLRMDNDGDRAADFQVNLDGDHRDFDNFYPLKT